MVVDQDANKASLDELSNADAFKFIGQLIDQASDAQEADLVSHALDLAEQLEARGLSAPEVSLLDYFRSNAWACRYQKRYRERQALWEFEQPEVEQQVFLLRRAIHSAGFAELEPIRRCQILTNLGNQFDTLGRFVDARACWSAALAIDPHFWMARGNRGRGLMFYAAALYDSNQRGLFALHAHRDLAEAAEHVDAFPHLGDSTLRKLFADEAGQIAQRFDLRSINEQYRPDDWPLGNDSIEQTYRHWCLKNTLFLNPLNDVERVPVAAKDILNLPDFALPAGEPPVVTGMYNELKQLFASARWLLWEGSHSTELHFSDHGVQLFNTLDYPSYGLAVEKVKVAFRMSYSVFDKIAYFLNFYLGLNIPERQVSFRTIWKDNDGAPLRDSVANSENWPLRGLYWLSKDLFEKSSNNTIEPEARALAVLRNHLEHKYVKVHEQWAPIPGKDDPFYDPLAYHILRSELERKTERLLQLVRSALVYLSLAMHRKELQRAKDRQGRRGVIRLDIWEDDWKR